MARPGRQVAWATSSEPKSNAGVSTQMMQTSPRTSASVVLRATKNSVFWDRRGKDWMRNGQSAEAEDIK